MTLHLRGAAFATVLLVATAAAPGLAQQADKSTAGPNQPAAARSVPKPVQPKGAAPKRASESQNRPWSLEDALPKGSSALPQSEPAKGTGAGLGRVPLQSGSFGFETETMVKTDRLPDGRRIPGTEANTRPDPSYLGLSLSVPTHDKTIIPTPPWVRAD